MKVFMHDIVVKALLARDTGGRNSKRGDNLVTVDIAVRTHDGMTRIHNGMFEQLWLGLIKGSGDLRIARQRPDRCYYTGLKDRIERSN